MIVLNRSAACCAWPAARAARAAVPVVHAPGSGLSRPEPERRAAVRVGCIAEPEVFIQGVARKTMVGGAVLIYSSRITSLPPLTVVKSSRARQPAIAESGPGASPSTVHLPALPDPGRARRGAVEAMLRYATEPWTSVT